jgi:ATP-dependent protease HslVU (ClpYQ) peptidase subunit
VTVVAAVIDHEGGKVHMAADSLAIGRDDLHVTMRKILTAEVGGAVTLIGVAGQCSLIPLAAGLIAETPGDDLDGWAQQIAKEITASGVELGAKEDDGTLNGEMLLARGAHLWDISHHSAIPITLDYAAVGSGAAVALGAMWAMSPGFNGDARIVTPAAVRAERGVQAAIAHVSGIGGPITTAST